MLKKLKTLSWCMYDFGTTAFMMNIVSLSFVQWIDQNFGNGDTYYGIISAIGYVLCIFLYPIAGETCDRGKKMLPLAVLTVLSVAGTFCIGLSDTLWLGALCFTLAYLTYQITLPYYTALLDDITTPDKFGIISGLGVGARYCGALIGLMILNFFLYTSYQQTLPSQFKPLLVKPEEKTFIFSIDTKYQGTLDQESQSTLSPFSESLREEFGKNSVALSKEATVEKGDGYWLIHDKTMKKSYFIGKHKDNPALLSIHHETTYCNAFIPTAILYGLCTLPLLFLVRPKKKQTVNETGMFKNILDGIKIILQSKNTVLFMATVLFSGISVYAAIHFMTIFLKNIGGVPDSLLLNFLIVATLCSIGGALAFGFSLRPLGSKTSFTIVLLLWIVVGIAGSLASGIMMMWILIPIAGIGMGGFWAVSRILVMDIAPKGREGTYISFYAIVLVGCGLLCSVIWPLGVWITPMLGFTFTPQRTSLLFLGLMGLISLWTFKNVQFSPK